jgi:hypothetical protein
MKTVSILTAFAALLLTSCHELKPLGDILLPPEGGERPLTNVEVVEGLKEALVRGATLAADRASQTDGFYQNPLLFIPFPEEAIKVKETAERLGFSNQVTQFEMTLNRAAEEASKEALQVFASAIRGMSIADGFAILRGESNAATQYLRATTGAELEERFRKPVREAIDKVQLTAVWEPLVRTYNLASPFAGTQQVNPDLETYVTERAINGLFVHVEREEALIRQDPKARVTDLLRRVFGS